MTLHDWLEIAALVAGPTLGVWLASRLQTTKDRRSDRYGVLSSLVGTRFDPLTPERLRALSMIEVVFAEYPDVLRYWREWHASVSDPGLSNPAGIQQRNLRYNDLIIAIAKASGYRTLTANELARSYVPESMAKMAVLRVQNEVEWNRIIRNSEHLGKARSGEISASVLDESNTQEKA